MNDHDIDEKLRAALGAAEEELVSELEELSMPEAVCDSLKGPSGGLVMLTFCSLLVFLAGAIWTAVGLVRAEAPREMILWASGLMYCLIIILGMKIWYWMELGKNALKRELKRVELQVAVLATRLDGLGGLDGLDGLDEPPADDDLTR